MTKDQILQLTGLSEDQFYDQYPDQESFCADYPDACAALTEASKGGAVKPMSPSQTVRSVASNNKPVFTGVVANPMEYMYKHGGGIHINPANKGKFTASANRAGMGVQEFARHVLANKEDYSATQVKRANFARNASKWKHADGGTNSNSQIKKPIYYSQEEFDSNPSLRQKVADYKKDMDMYNTGDFYYDIQPYLLQREPEIPFLQSPQEALVNMQGVPITMSQQPLEHSGGWKMINGEWKRAPIEFKPKPVAINLGDSFKQGGQLTRYQMRGEVTDSTIYPPYYNPFIDYFNQTMVEEDNPDDTVSLSDYLSLSGIDNSKKNRKKIADKVGLKNYDYSAVKNTELLNFLRANNPPLYQKGGYVVKSGDNLSAIAAANKMSLPQLLSMNPQFRENPNLIHVGDKVMIETPMQRSNREYGAIADAAMNRQKMMQYQVTPTDARSVTSVHTTINSAKKTANVSKSTPKSLPGKKEAKQEKYNLGNMRNVLDPRFVNFYENPEDPRNLESGMIVDKNQNVLYVIDKNKAVNSFPVMTGLNKNRNITASTKELEDNPSYRATPMGVWYGKPVDNLYGKKAYDIQPLNAFTLPKPTDAPKGGISIHTLYGLGKKGTDGYEPAEGRRRLNIMQRSGSQRVGSYGCINMYGQHIDCLTGELFPQGDTVMVTDSRFQKDKKFLNSFGIKEKGGDVFPAMRTMFRTGGYYGMDGRFHKNTDSGTYVAAGGYYFQPGGPVTDDIPPGMNPQSAMELPSEFQSDFAYSNPSPETPTFDMEDYKTSIDPNTGFRTYTKKGTDTPYTNIKKQDEALWENLKEKGHGARWETGQTDFQRFAKQAQKVGQISQGVIDSAGILGNFISNQQGRRNMTNAAINMGSTDAMFSNPQSSSKGDYGVTGSMYGTLKPYKSSNMSFKGMYGEYGMEVPKFQYGAGFSNLFGSAQSSLPISSPVELMSNVNMSVPEVPISDNTRVATPRVRPEKTEYTEENNNNDLKEMIAAKESKGRGGYQALPWMNKAKTKLASSAAGKYQFLWGEHKNDIKKVTGVKTKEEFLNNPNAQEEFFDYWDETVLTPWANKIRSQLKVNMPVNKIKAAIHFSGPKGAWDYFSKGIKTKDAFGSTTSSYMTSLKNGGQLGGQVVEMDENQIQQFLAAGGQLEFID